MPRAHTARDQGALVPGEAVVDLVQVSAQEDGERHEAELHGERSLGQRGRPGERRNHSCPGNQPQNWGPSLRGEINGVRDGVKRPRGQTGALEQGTGIQRPCLACRGKCGR